MQKILKAQYNNQSRDKPLQWINYAKAICK